MTNKNFLTIMTIAIFGLIGCSENWQKYEDDAILESSRRAQSELGMRESSYIIAYYNVRQEYSDVKMLKSGIFKFMGMYKNCMSNDISDDYCAIYKELNEAKAGGVEKLSKNVKYIPTPTDIDKCDIIEYRYDIKNNHFITNPECVGY